MTTIHLLAMKNLQSELFLILVCLGDLLVHNKIGKIFSQIRYSGLGCDSFMFTNYFPYLTLCNNLFWFASKWVIQWITCFRLASKSYFSLATSVSISDSKNRIFLTWVSIMLIAFVPNLLMQTSLMDFRRICDLFLL